MNAVCSAGITESQLSTWSRQGAVQTSSSTYTSIKAALDSGTRISSKRWDYFLQGSYANATNIRGDSDVDVVCCLESTYYRDLSLLPPHDRALYEHAFPAATYGFAAFKRDVTADMKDYYGEDLVRAGDNAVWVRPASGRLDADVIVCCQYRRYLRFRTVSEQEFTQGITFWRSDGTQVINYPRHHLAACKQKHQATNGWFKPVVRVVKNIRCKMAEAKMISSDVAPSYFIEGLLWNAPAYCYGRSYSESIVALYNYLTTATGAQCDAWTCPNGVYRLFGPRPEQWTKAHCGTFLRAFKEFWDNH